MSNYYDILQLQPKATLVEVEARFRRMVARYRATLTVEQLFGDPRFLTRVNAYLTLHAPHRERYDEALAKLDKDSEPPEPKPLEGLTPLERQTFMARIALWRREPLEAIHLLRSMLEKTPDYAPGWALFGEVYFTVERVEEGVKAYEKAVAAAPDNTSYASRLQHARDALAGKVRLKVELSPEEEMLREERRKRAHITIAVLCLGVAAVIYSFAIPIQYPEEISGTLFIPWRSVFVQSVAAFVLLLALSFGRLLQPFERVMIWSSLSAGDRGSLRNYPLALLMVVTAAPSLWLAAIAFTIIGIMDEEWPVSVSIMLGTCMLLNLGLVFAVFHATGHHWSGTLILGGNVPALAAMLGWWAGSMNSPQYD